MYYFDDGVSFASKIKAIEYGNKINQDAKLYYFDETYNKVSWSLEPTQSLQQLYTQQAQRIRDTYDYVILCYSGGYDSTNILETFYYNNIALDKIIVVGAMSQDSFSGVDENHNGELYHNVFPYIDELGLQNITEVIDYTKYFNDVNNFSITQYANEWIDYTGTWHSPHNWFWRDIEKYVIPKAYSDKKVAIIFGKDKPRLFRENDKIGFRFFDGPITSYGNSLDNGNSKRINFYWDPSMPEILVKQLHILARIARSSKILPESIDHDIVNNVVYDLKKKLLFKSGKSATGLLSLRDMYLINKTNSDVFRFYASGISNMKKHINVKDIRPIYSRFYSIE